MDEVNKVIIIGSGPAGLTAGIYLARADLKPLILAGKTPGGQLMRTSEVENFPGFPEGIKGPDLMFKLMAQAEKFGAEIIEEDVVSVDFDTTPLKVATSTQSFEAETVLLAMGAVAKRLGVPGEEEFWGRGVSTCATCDGVFFRDQKVVVVGGGDAAMEEALFLSKFATWVTVLVRNASAKEMRASETMKKRAEENKKIELLFNRQVQEIMGDKVVTGVKLLNKTVDQEEEIACQGVFVAIGHEPRTAFLKDQIDLNEKGYVQSSDGVHTSREGVFVAGDVQDYKYRQAITASGFGCMAASEIEKYLEGNRLS